MVLLFQGAKYNQMGNVLYVQMVWGLLEHNNQAHYAECKRVKILNLYLFNTMFWEHFPHLILIFFTRLLPKTL